MWKAIRWVLAAVILLMDAVFKPSRPKHAPAVQQSIDESTKALRLYEFKACPFCVKVRRELVRLGAEIERRDASRNATFKRELVEGGGQYKVPCLRITTADGSYTWLYESDAIIHFLRQQLAGQSAL